MPQVAMRSFSFLVVVMLSLSSLASAQSPCQSSQYTKPFTERYVEQFISTSQNAAATFTPPCDSMMVVNKPTFVRLVGEAFRLDSLLGLSEKALQKCNDMLRTQEDISAVQERHIAALEANRDSLNASNQELTIKLDESINNTDRAVRKARRYRALGIVGTIAGVFIGRFAL